MAPLRDSKVYYLGGPMTGLPEYNFPAFDDAAECLRRSGLTVRSAHEIDFGEDEKTRGETKTHGEYMRGCLKLLLECDAVIFLDGWGKSNGCLHEFAVATAIKMDVWQHTFTVTGHTRCITMRLA